MKHCLQRIAALSILMLPLSANALLSTCTVTATGITVPSYASPGNTTVNGTGSVDVTCSLGLAVSYTISLSAGSGSFANRKLISGANFLNYNMYTDTGRTTIWGDGSAGTSTVSASFLIWVGGAQSYTVYMSVPGGQNQPAGTYIDTPTVTVTY